MVKLKLLKFCVVFYSERRQVGVLLNTVIKSKLNMPYEILEKATDYFSDSNKLGEGGSGSVYKVTLSSSFSCTKKCSLRMG